MPPTRKFQKEDVIHTAYEIAKKEGLRGINARKIASKLGCSVQPIFYYFENMEDLKKQVLDKMIETYHKYMLSDLKKENPYKQIGLSYIKFAKDYPEFFKTIFMEKSTLSINNAMNSDKTVIDEIVKVGSNIAGLSAEEMKTFHIKVWIFTHGIASMVATGSVKITPKEIEELLESSVRQMIKGYKLEKGDKK